MRRDIKVALEDTEQYLRLAERNKDKDYANRVIASLYIRTVIRGNDALCLKYIRETPNRHHQAPKFFQRLYEDGYISEKYSKYTSNLRDLIDKKSELFYKSQSLSKSSLERLRKKAKRFVENAVNQIFADYDF